MRLIDITGQRFGRLLVIRKLAPRKGGGSDWACACDCGKLCAVIGSNLRKGQTRSCGCLATEWSQFMGSNPEFVAKRAEKMVVHGHKRGRKVSREYKTWLQMKRRCYDPKCKDFVRYGARGIKVCDEWNESFEAFFAYMGPRPAGDYSIDRLRSLEDYKPGNCRWATRRQQCSENKRSNIPVTVNGRSFQSLAEAARHFGVDLNKMWCRVSLGVPPEIAVSTPGRLMRTRSRLSYLPKTHPDRLAVT